jgi:hypothetical protein
MEEVKDVGGRPADIRSDEPYFFEVMARYGYEGYDLDVMVGAALGCSYRTVKRARLGETSMETFKLRVRAALMSYADYMLREVEEDQEDRERIQAAQVNALVQRAMDNGWEPAR